nr:hypothetical protein [Tanacetum cinerariifolium]
RNWSAWGDSGSAFAGKMPGFAIPFARIPDGHSFGQSEQIAETSSSPGRGSGRRLQHDRGWRQGHGLPVRRQGQLHHARRADAP